MEETLIYSGEWFQKDAVSMSRLTGIMPMEDQFAPKKKWFPDSSWTAGPRQSDRQAVQKAGRRAGDRHSDRLIFLYLMSYKQERGTLFTFFFCLLLFYRSNHKHALLFLLSGSILSSQNPRSI